MDEFRTALDQFRRSYGELFQLLDTYPIDRREQDGACGDWSPKAVLAHLSGWIVEAGMRYEIFGSGDTTDVFYDPDPFNERSVIERAHLSWEDTVAELRRLVDNFTQRAQDVQPDAAVTDKRYREWLEGLANDCALHIKQLQTFAEKTLQCDYPILEYDESRDAIIHPARVIRPLDGIAEHCVLCFFQDVIRTVCGEAEVATHLGSEIGKNPVYTLDTEGGRVMVVHAGVGAPLSAAFLEEMIALGCRKFIACGGSGVLKREIAVGNVVIPTSAVRDEGTSYHYLPPAREVTAHPDAVAAIEAALKAHDIPYVTGKTWTTDAFYRETPTKIAMRKAEGCITVDMEAAAFFAVAQFREVVLGQILYGGDDVSGDQWDRRGWHERASTREKLFWLAVEAVLRL